MMLPLERDVLGYTYAEVGTELLRCWKMPENILDIVKAQHDPSLSPILK